MGVEQPYMIPVLKPHEGLRAFLITIRAFGVLADELIKTTENYELPASYKLFVGAWVIPLRKAATTAQALLRKLNERPR